MESYILKIYKELTGHTINEAVFAFDQLTIRAAGTGDLYFGTYGVPNTIELFHAPFERFTCYEYLMHSLKSADAVKFDLIHKGTPYYFLAWTAFDIGNFAKAIFYMDLALGEDIRKIDSAGKTAEAIAREALNNPGGCLWKLEPAEPATRTIAQLKDAVSKMLDEFHQRTTEQITLDDFVNNFVLKYISKDAKNRSLVSAIYSYICEARDLCETLEIRSQNISSIEPLLANLFKGGLIFETLLKLVSIERSWTITNGRRNIGQPASTLGEFGYCNDFLTLFGLSNGDLITGAPDLGTILTNATDDTLKTAFNVTSQLRNTAGHDLRRDDIFQNQGDYKKLVNTEINAIFFVIKKAIVEDGVK